jgi:hypothetical protein
MPNYHVFGHGHRVYADNRLPFEPAELKVTERAALALSGFA